MSKKQLSPNRVNIYLRGPQLEVRKMIDNNSAFIQICYDHAADIMAWAILYGVDPKKYHPIHKIDEPGLVENFNKRYPADPLFKGKEQWDSQRLPDVLL